LGLSSLPHAKPDAALAALNRTEWVDWEKVRTLKKTWIRSYIKSHQKELLDDPEYEKFVEKSPWLKSYAEFIALYEQSGYLPWWNWKKMDCEKALVQEAMLVQFLLHSQLLEVRKYADKLGIHLFGDLPIFVDKNSADAWANPEEFNFLYEAGVPPDVFNDEGQRWGFPLYNWDKIEQNNWARWQNRLATAANYYHLYRIDHLVGFFRTYGFPLNSGHPHFIPRKQDDWQALGYKILNAFTTMTNMLPIGEDLGTVPEMMKLEMRRLTIPGTKVMRWERYKLGGRSFIPSNQYDVLSLTCVSTHDSSLLPQWWASEEEDAKRFAKAFGLKWEKHLDFDTHVELLKLSHTSNSLFHVNLLNEYLALFPQLVHENLKDERINSPGIISPKNWSLKFKPSVEELAQNQLLIRTLKNMIV
jgi:4-alpha-glucanotransferase